MLWMRTPEKVYFKKGCMPVALDELGMYARRRVYRNRQLPLQEWLRQTDRR